MSPDPAAGHDQLVTGLAVAALVAVGLTYRHLAARRTAEPRGWARHRTGPFLAGLAVLAAALLPSASPYPQGDLRGHMVQHLLIGMVAPLLLVLGAPLTLVLRSVSRPTGRRISGVLRSTPVRILTHPAGALVLSLGGLALVLLTPLSGLVRTGGLLHVLWLVHVLAAGYLFAWVIAGPDPAPHRPSVTARLVALGLAIAVHAGLSQLLYAGVLGQVTATAVERRGAAEWMYYGGDLAELALAVALVVGWRPARPRPAGQRPTGQRPANPPAPAPSPTDEFSASTPSTSQNAGGDPAVA